MREKKHRSYVIKRILSSVMAFAIALSMCMVAVPQRVLADSVTEFWVDTTGEIVTVDPTNYYMYGQIYNASPTSVLGYADSTLIFNSAVKLGNLRLMDKNQSILVTGDCEIRTIILTNSKLKIKMNSGSSLTITDAVFTSTIMSLSKAVTEEKIIELVDGKIDENNENKAVYNAPAPGPDDPTPDPEPTPTPEPTPSDIKVNDEVSEKGKTAEEAPTYKVTKKEGNTGEITYEKPATKAENVKEVEEVPSEVVLGDGNTYKVTKVGDRAFADAPGNDKIKEIKLGENVEEIGSEACKGLPSLEKVTLNKKVKKIDKGAFALCKKLKKADLPADLEEVGESAFEKTNIPSATFGKKVKKIGKKAYYKCKKLKKLTVKSKKLTKKSRVAKNAFAGASKKLKVKIKVSKAKTKDSIIKVFKQKKIGYKSTWTVG